MRQRAIQGHARVEARRTAGEAGAPADDAGGKTTTDELSPFQQTEAFNTLEWIEAAINNAEDERLVCHREKTLGSNRVTRVCRTVEEERIVKERAKEQLQRNHGDLRLGR